MLTVGEGLPNSCLRVARLSALFSLQVRDLQCEVAAIVGIRLDALIDVYQNAKCKLHLDFYST